MFKAVRKPFSGFQTAFICLTGRPELLETAALHLQAVGVQARGQTLIAQGVGQGDGQPVGGIGLRRARQPQHPHHHILNLLLGRLALPDYSCLTCRAVYSYTGRPRITKAATAAPRACPSIRVAAGFTLTNTCSTAACCGL